MKKFIPLAILALLIVPAYVVGARSDSVSEPKPSIVLIHGAWADGSGWSGVISRLQDQGYTVYAPSNPLRGLASDSAYIANFLQSISGPIILVGHSYGGAVEPPAPRLAVLSVLPAMSGVPAWKSIPSWYLLGTIDLVIPPYLQLFMAQRAHAQIVDVRAAHPSMISHPEAVTQLIEQAAQTVTENSNIGSGLTLASASL